MLTGAGWGRPQAFPNPLSELDRVQVFRRTHGSPERGFGLGLQRPWIDEPARAQVGEDEPPNAGRAGRLSCIGRRRMSHGVRLFCGLLWTVGVVDEEIRPTRVLDDLPGRSGVYGEDREGTSLGDAEAYALKTVVKQEGCNLSLAYLGRLPWDQLPPAEAFAKPALCARKRQVEEVSQRTERVGRGVNEKRGLREGRQGGEQGSEPADVVEVAVTQEQVAHVLQRNPGGLEATEQHGAAGGVDQHRFLTRER